MRGGVRLPALAVAIGLLAGCSDPAGAVRRERAAAARKATPSPSASAAKKPGHHAPTWWQAPGGTKTAGGLHVRAGALSAGRMRITVTDIEGRVSRTLVATAKARGAIVGRFALTGIKVAKHPKTGAYGVTFHYHRR